MQSTFATTSLAAMVREGGQIDVRPDPDFVARVVETRRRCDAGGDRDREEQERQEGGEPAAAREEPEEPAEPAEPEEPAAGGEAKRGGRGGRGEEDESPTAERRGGGSDERRGATDLRGAERGGHRPRRNGSEA